MLTVAFILREANFTVERVCGLDETWGSQRHEASGFGRARDSCLSGEAREWRYATDFGNVNVNVKVLLT